MYSVSIHSEEYRSFRAPGRRNVVLIFGAHRTSTSGAAKIITRNGAVGAPRVVAKIGLPTELCCRGHGILRDDSSSEQHIARVRDAGTREAAVSENAFPSKVMLFRIWRMPPRHN